MSTHNICFIEAVLNVYPQSLFLSKNKKIMYTPVNPTVYKSWVKGGLYYTDMLA